MNQIFELDLNKKDTLMYYKGFDKNGNIIDSYLSLNISKTENDSISIYLNYFEADSLALGIILGELSDENKLLDTIKVDLSKSNKVVIPKNINQKSFYLELILKSIIIKMNF
ncbi:MAG: hypothetical protein ACQETL_09755 [Bacteroidota bacterium]